MNLLTYVKEADYYAFCDQDDVWLPNKIEKAVKRLEQSEKQVPTMYFSNYDYYDENMVYLTHSPINKMGPSFQNALVECISPGMTMVINRSLRDIIVTNKKEKAMYHDWMVYLIASGIGTVIYDKEVTVKYRRHTKNISSANQNFLKVQWWRIQQIVKNTYFKKVKDQLIEFEQNYADNLKQEDKELLSLFTKRNNSISNRMKKVCYPHQYRQKQLDDVLLRGLFLLGIL